MCFSLRVITAIKSGTNKATQPLIARSSLLIRGAARCRMCEPIFCDRVHPMQRGCIGCFRITFQRAKRRTEGGSARVESACHAVLAVKDECEAHSLPGGGIQSLTAPRAVSRQRRAMPPKRRPRGSDHHGNSTRTQPHDSARNCLSEALRNRQVSLVAGEIRNFETSLYLGESLKFAVKGCLPFCCARRQHGRTCDGPQCVQAALEDLASLTCI